MPKQKANKSEHLSSSVTLKITCDSADSAELDDLSPFQGELKSLSEENFSKLKNSFIRHGFMSPIYVWFDGDRANILDGHQRLRTLKLLRDREGWTIPRLPIVKVSANGEDEAKRKLLQFCSDFGTIETEGLYEFISEAGLGIDELFEDFTLRQIDMDSFKVEFFDDLDGPHEPEGSDDKKEDASTCPECGQRL